MQIMANILHKLQYFYSDFFSYIYTFACFERCSTAVKTVQIYNLPAELHVMVELQRNFFDDAIFLVFIFKTNKFLCFCFQFAIDCFIDIPCAKTPFWSFGRRRYSVLSLVGIRQSSYWLREASTIVLSIYWNTHGLIESKYWYFLTWGIKCKFNM